MTPLHGSKHFVVIGGRKQYLQAELCHLHIVIKISLGSQLLFLHSNSLYLKQGRLYKKSVGDKLHPCLTLQFTGNDSVHWPRLP